MFSYLFNRKYLPQEIKLLLYMVTIRSFLLYGFPIFFTIPPIVAKELEAFERKILRSHKEILKHLRIWHSRVQTVCKYALHHKMMFVEKLVTHENPWWMKFISWNEVYNGQV